LKNIYIPEDDENKSVELKKHKRKSCFITRSNCLRKTEKALFQFQVRDFSFWITERIGLTGVSFHFWPQKQIPSVAALGNIWLLVHFQVKYWQILMFDAWFDVKFYADLKKVYFMGSKVQSKSMRAPKRNLFIMKFWEVVWPIHRSEILCWAQNSILYELKCNRKSWEPKNV
jgi:hypothetical protein